MLSFLRLISVFPLLLHLSRPVQGVAEDAVPQQLWSPLVAAKVNATAWNVSATQYPQYTDRTSGQWIDFPTDYWTSGFLPATLYAMHTREELCPSLSSGVNWLGLGRRWSAGLTALEAHNTVGHDVGFISMPFVDEITLNPFNVTAENVVKAFGLDLANRYSPIVGCTRSWDAADPTNFQVIIDNMMNIDLFFTLEQLTGNSTYRHMAITHADKTLSNHIRPDGSSYHVVDYNSTTGVAFWRGTSQGYSDNSTWTRGQSWGIYGFANMHRRTLNTSYLATARHMASYFLEHIPADGIVPWDFQAPLNPPRPADSSAAMIATNGLLLLARQEQVISNTSGAAHWANAAMKLFGDNVQFAWKPQWQSLLANGTVNNPAHNNLTGIIYGDYYFIQAGNTMLQMGLADCP